MKGKLSAKSIIIAVITAVAIAVAVGITLFFTLRESHEKSAPKIVFAQDDVTATVGETKMLHATVQLPDGTVIEDGLKFVSSDTSVLQFGDEHRGVFRVLDIADPPEKVEVTVSAPAYSVDTKVSVSIVRYANKLNLNYNGASTPGAESVNAYYLHRIYDLPTPQKTNYVFVGWFTAAGEQYKNGDMFMGRENVSLTAKFSTLLTLDCENGSKVDVEEVEFNKPLPELITPEKTGWQFEGWFTQRGGAGKEYKFGDVYNENDVTLYAKWVREVGLVSPFDGGSGNVKVVYAAPVPEIEAPDYSQYEGALFGGWFTQPNGAGSALADSGIYEFDDASVLYACVASEVQFDGNTADSLPVSEHFYIPLGGTYGRLENLPIPTKERWEFDGWYTDVNGEGDKITDDTEYAALKSGIVLHACWRSNFELATELGKPSTVRVTYGKPFAPSALSTQSGWTFEGWYSQPYCEGAKEGAVDFYSGEGSRTLYAGWKKELTINYHGQEHAGEPEKLSVIYGLSLDAQNKPLPVYTQTGIVQLWSISETRSADTLVTMDHPLPKEADTLHLLWGLAGSGTEVSPYTVSNERGLNLFADSVNATETIYNASGVVVKVTANITMSGTWNTPIANNNWAEYFSTSAAAVSRRFVGTFDGGGKTVYNLTVNIPASAGRVDTYVGLFGYIGAGGVVRNVNLSNVNINGASVRDNTNTNKGGANNGGIAGLNSGTVTNCTVTGTVTGTAELDTQIGGIVGYMFRVGALVEGCVNYAAVSGTAGRCTSHGGITGSVNNGHLVNCTNSGKITGVNLNKYHYNSSEGSNGYQFYGGISGVCCAVIEGCVNKGAVQAGYVASFGSVGGAEIVGYLHDGSDSNISSNSNQSLYIDTTSGIRYSNTYYYSGVINCSTTNSGKYLLGFVQNDHRRIAVTQGYNNRTNRYSGSRAVELSGTYSIKYLSVDSGTSALRAVICDLAVIEEPSAITTEKAFPVWAIALICVVGGAGLIAGTALTVVFVTKRKKKQKFEK